MSTFYIESGTGAQVTDPTQLNPTKTYTQSGTGATGLGSSFYTSPTTSSNTTSVQQPNGTYTLSAPATNQTAWDQSQTQSVLPATSPNYQAPAPSNQTSGYTYTLSPTGDVIVSQNGQMVTTTTKDRATQYFGYTGTPTPNSIRPPMGARAGDVFTVLGTQYLYNLDGSVVPYTGQTLQTNTTQPTTPTPTTTTPTTQTPTTTNSQTTTPGTQTPTTQTSQNPALAMPANGSVVDLLNMAGQDSSYASRQQLAHQFGIQGYTGTAAQNTELAQKYLSAYNAKKGSTAPQTGAEARSALSDLTSQGSQPTDPQAQFFDSFGSLSPIESNLFSQLSTLMSTQANQQSLTDFYQQELAAQGIPGINTQLADINKIMSGTEDDIRTEITHAGGFATDSQVQALTGARNKTLLKQATYLTDLLNTKNDYVNTIVNLTKADRETVSQQIDQKLNLTKTVFDMGMQMQNAAKDNYNKIIDTAGYEGLATALQGDKSALNLAEQTLGLPKGALTNPAFLASVSQGEWSDPYKLGGSYVQKNTKTGEIRTAADIPSTSSGTGLVGPSSYQEWTLAGSPGTYANWLSNSKTPSVAQNTVATYAARLEQSNPTITGLESTISGMNPATFEIQKNLPSYFQSSDFQQYDQASRNFINAVLRRESGAVISPSEFDNAYKQYLPRAGDTQATLDLKRNNRDLVFASLKNAAGNAYQSVNDLLGALPTTPSGTYQVNYNGKTYSVDSKGNMTELK